MKPEEAFEIRRKRWEKLKDFFLPMVVQGAIDTELEGYDVPSGPLQFSTDLEDWTVVCWVPIFYHHFGFDQKDEAEVPAYIEATGNFIVKGKKIEPRATLKIKPPKNIGGPYEFLNLDTLVKDIVLGRKNVSETPTIFTMETLMQDPMAPPSKDETNAMVERLVEALVEMGYSRRGAFRSASKVVAEHTDIESIDRLLDLIIEG